MFDDPLRTINVALSPGWALDPISCSLTSLVFLDWTSPVEGQIFISAVSPHAPQSETTDAWEDAVRSTLPDEASRVERREGPIVLVTIAGNGGRLDERWAIVRGPRLDVTLKQVEVPPSGALSTPELAMAMRTLDIPVNRHVPPRPGAATWDSEMQAAAALAEGMEHDQAINHLLTARSAATDSWMLSLPGNPIPDIPAALQSAQASLALARISLTALHLRDATISLQRVRRSLNSLQVPIPPHIVAEADEAIQTTLEMHQLYTFGGPPPQNEVSACMSRALDLLIDGAMAISKGGRIDSTRALAAFEDGKTAVAYAHRIELETPSPDVGIHLRNAATEEPTDPGYVEENVEVVALSCFAATCAGLDEAGAFADGYVDPTFNANWVLAERRLRLLSPDTESVVSLAEALMRHAMTLSDVGDESALVEAEALMSEAEMLADEIGDEGVLRSKVSLGLATARGLSAETLPLVDRALAAARAAGDDRLERAACSLRSSCLLAAGRIQEAVRDARLSMPPDEAPSSAHFLNLAVALNGAGDSAGALEQARAGLSAALADDPLGLGVLSQLHLAATLLDPTDRVLSLAATEAADCILDFLRLHIGDTADRINFDDGGASRQVAATLVQRRLDANDILGALATADRHRARSLVGTASLRNRYSDSGGAVDRPQLGHIEKGADPLPPEARLPEQIAWVQGNASLALASAGAPLPQGGEVLVRAVDATGRAALVLAPSGEQLLQFLVSPGSPPRVVSRVSATTMPEVGSLAESLRAQLGIVVATRAARGEMPPQRIEELAKLFVDDDDETLDEANLELERLQRRLYDAILADVEPLLTEQEPLVIVPFRELAMLPISVLRGHDGCPVSEHHPLSIVPSLASLAVLGQAGEESVAKAVVVGDPVLPAESGFGPLHGAAAEAKSVAAALTTAGLSTVSLTNAEATESAFRSHSAGARVLHLACHAAVREPAAASALFLTPDAPDDGLLLAGEIADLRFDGALVVLAACQTGLGRATADGVLGLGRAFMQAGARAIVLSLWRVDDAATASLMEELYSGLLGTAEDLDGPLDVAAALQRAQLLTRERVSADPSVWGPWLLVGDGGWRL